MRETLISLYVKLQNLMICEEGQDLIEYGLLVSMIACAAVAGIDHVATAVTKMFTNISTSMA